MGIKKFFFNIYNSIKEFVSTQISLYQIEKEIVTNIVTRVEPYNDTFITLKSPNRFMFDDILTLILKKIPKDDAIYSISFEFFAEGSEGERMYNQNYKISTDLELYKKFYRSYVFMLQRYEYLYLEKIEVRILYLQKKGEIVMDRKKTKV
jgi:hypothetical protein